ncbi:MAG: hypothetical protein QW291_00825 [Thermofilaceae archaeon]
MCERSGASQVVADIVEVDVKMETVKLIVEGEKLDLELRIGCWRSIAAQSAA